MEKVIDITRSICEICLTVVPARIIEENNSVYLSKHCSTHGETKVLVALYPENYRELREAYFKLMKFKIKQRFYALYITNQCNLGCELFTCVGNCKDNKSENSALDLTMADLKFILRNKTKPQLFFLSGAEPTFNKEWLEMARLLKEEQKVIFLYTNGSQFKDSSWVEKLKNLKVDKIYFRLNGLDNNLQADLKAETIISKRQYILDIFKQVKAPTVLGVTLLKGVNPYQLKDVFDYALNNTFICEVNFTTYFRSSKVKDFPKELILTSDEVISILERETQGLITGAEMGLFQKFFYSYMSFFRKRVCFSTKCFWIFKSQTGEAIPITRLLDLKSVEEKLNKYVDLFNKNALLGKIYFIFILAILIKNILRNQPRVFKEIVRMGYYHIFNKRGKYTHASSRFLQIIISSCCRVIDMDFKLNEFCHAGLIWKGKQGEIKYLESIWEYLLANEGCRGVDLRKK